MVTPVRVNLVQVAPVHSSDKKNIDGFYRAHEEKVPFSYGWQTPPVEKGYQGIAKKAIGNATLSIISIAMPPLYVLRSGVDLLGVTLKSAVFMTCGALGLIATPVILAKDLTHHTYRVLSQKFSESDPLLKKN